MQFQQNKPFHGNYNSRTPSKYEFMVQQRNISKETSRNNVPGPSFRMTATTPQVFRERTSQSVSTLFQPNSMSSQVIEGHHQEKNIFSKMPKFKENKFDDGEKESKVNIKRFMTGSAERLIKWHKMNDNFCYYELIAALTFIKEGSAPRQKIMLLRDLNKGPVLQVVYYDTDYIKIDDFHMGQMLRCVGHMLGPNVFRAFKIRTAHPNEVTSLMRMYYISEHALMLASAN